VTEALDDSIDVIGMMELLPAPPLQLLERRARVFVAAFIEPVDPARWVGSPDELTDVVGQLPKARLAFAKRVTVLTGDRHGSAGLTVRRCVTLLTDEPRLSRTSGRMVL
jgi:hypothetical protein